MNTIYHDPITDAIAILELDGDVAQMEHGEPRAERRALIARLICPSTKRHLGGATRVMRAVLVDADDSGFTLYLTALASGLDTDPDDAALIAWYERHGFRLLNAERSKHMMVRPPREEAKAA